MNKQEIKPAEFLLDTTSKHLGEFPGISRTVDWIGSQHPFDLFTRDIYSIDRLISKVNQRLKKSDIDPGYQVYLGKLHQESLHPLPLIEDIFSLASLSKGKGKKAVVQAAKETLKEFKAKLVLGQWQIPTDGQLRTDSLAEILLLEGYGLFLEKYWQRLGIAVTCSLALREAIYTIDIGNGYTDPLLLFRNNILPWVYAERHLFSNGLQKKLDGIVLGWQVTDYREQLRVNYNAFEGYRPLARRTQIGSENFASALDLAFKKSDRNRDIVEAVRDALMGIAQWPLAGVISWELRRIIRRADPETIVTIADLLSKLADKFPAGRKKGDNIYPLTGDSVYDYEWDPNLLDQALKNVIEGLREELEDK